MLKTKIGALENYQMQFHGVEIGGKIMCIVSHEFANISSPYGQALKKVIPAALAKEKAFLITSQNKGEEQKKIGADIHPSFLNMQTEGGLAKKVTPSFCIALL